MNCSAGMGAVCELLSDVYRQQVIALSCYHPVLLMHATVRFKATLWQGDTGARCQDTSVTTRKCSPAVDPPEDLTILDPGFLGYLKISWSPPASLTNVTECPKLYQLEYFDAYSGRWNVSAEFYSTLLNTPPVLTKMTAYLE